MSREATWRGRARDEQQHPRLRIASRQGRAALKTVLDNDGVKLISYRIEMGTLHSGPVYA